MTRPAKFVLSPRLSRLLLWAASMAAFFALTAGAQQTAWIDRFGGSVDTARWIIVNGPSPGYIPNSHFAYSQADHVSIVRSYLTLLLTQEYGQVDSNQNGIISRGATIYTRQIYGYGTYEWRMRFSSTATTPTGPGNSVSGSGSAGFIYVNNSATEIDFEAQGQNPGVLYMTNWNNTNTAADPTPEMATSTNTVVSDLHSEFHTYKFVWDRASISFYVDDVLKSIHTTNVPSAPANFYISHGGTNSTYWGGLATVGTPRYVYVSWVKYTPPTGKH